jgi:enoyl-CoA hydratase/carnithine racemase
VAALSGYTAGAGLQLALCADVIVASPSLQIWIPQVSLGLSPHIATLARLSAIIGHNRALRLALTGERLGADDALSWGLLSEVVPQERLLSRATELAEAIASHPRIAVQMTKAGLRAAMSPTGELLAMLDLAKSYGMVETAAWQRKRATLVEDGARRRDESDGPASSAGW